MNEWLLKLSNLTLRQCIVFSGMISFGYYFMLFDNGAAIKEQIQAISKSLEEEKAKEKESDLALQEVDIVKSQLEHLAQQYHLLSSQLPRELSSAKIIRVIDVIAESSGAQIRSKEPKSTKIKESIEEFPLLVKGEGSFGSIVRFIKNTLAQEIIFRIRSASLSAEKDVINSGIKFSFEISSFRFIEGEKSK